MITHRNELLVPPTRSAPSVVGRGALGTSLLLIAPLFLIYEIGLLVAPYAMNGVDFVTRWMVALADHSRAKFLLINLCLAVLFGWLVYARRDRIRPLRAFLPMFLESAAYAAVVGFFIVMVMKHLLGFTHLSMALDDAVFASAGAGFHEEMVFRLGLMMGGAYVLRECGVRHGLAVAIALVVSSLLFSAVHHIGTGGDPWRADVFVYRALAGAVLGVLAYFRSLAHAVYTHFLYDVYVMAF